MNRDIIARIVKASGIVAWVDGGKGISPVTGLINMKAVKSRLGTVKVEARNGKQYPAMAALIVQVGGNPTQDDWRTSESAVKVGQIVREMIEEELGEVKPRLFKREAVKGENGKAKKCEDIQGAEW